MKFRLVENSFRRNSKWNDSIDRNITLPKSKAPINNNLISNEPEVKDITLLSIEEVKQLPLKVREFYYWWLQSLGLNSNYAATVNFAGSVDFRGHRVDDGAGVVRPALIIPNLKSSNLIKDFNLYDEVEFKGIKWIIISGTMLLCYDNSFGQHRFDEESNNYEKSEIKKYIHIEAREFGLL